MGLKMTALLEYLSLGGLSKRYLLLLVKTCNFVPIKILYCLSRYWGYCSMCCPIALSKNHQKDIMHDENYLYRIIWQQNARKYFQMAGYWFFKLPKLKMLTHSLPNHICKAKEMATVTTNSQRHEVHKIEHYAFE